jgi:cell division protein FtsB
MFETLNMKIIIITLLLSLLACGRDSSPDGRSQIRDENIQSQLDSLKGQNKALLDSITIINEEIKRLKIKN